MGKTGFFFSLGLGVGSEGGSEIWKRARRRTLASSVSRGRVVCTLPSGGPAR